MATLDSFREATGEPIQLDLANGYIADIRLNAGDINGRTITVELTDNGTPSPTPPASPSRSPTTPRPAAGWATA